MVRNIGIKWRHRVPQVCFVLVLAFSGVLVGTFWKYSEALSWVSHTNEVKSGISAMLEDMQNAAVGTRTYLLAPNDLAKKASQESMAQVVPTIDFLELLTVDNPAQQRHLKQLRPIVQEIAARDARVVERRGRTTLDDALSVFDTGADMPDIQQFRDTIFAMQQEEARLFASRLDGLHRSLLTLEASASLLLLIVVASLILWMVFENDDARRTIISDVRREEQESRIRQMHKVDAIGELTGGLAHDLNNMLAVIVSGLNLVERRIKAGDADVQRFLDAAMDGAMRAAKLTGRLMAFARQQPLASVKIEPNRLIVGMDELLQSSLGQAIKVQTVLSSGLWPVNTDVGQLENAILNLAVNARDAMPQGGQLTIETANTDFDATYAMQNGVQKGQYVQIAVSDTGTGMSAETIAKAFDPFFTTKGVGKGTGLGLSQVYGFVKQSGGNIKIYSELGHGTSIKMYLPRSRQSAEDKQIDAARVEAWPNLKKDNSAHLVLVVEDDPRVNEMTVSSLRELGYTVIHADGASGALDLLSKHPGTALLFTDIVMPDVNGRQLAAEALKRFPQLKVLYTTGFAKNALLRTDKMNHNLNLIAKPFTLVQIADKLREVLAV